MDNFVYILECVDGTYYTGWTNDPSARLRSHNSGRGAKYTRGRRPVKLIYLERCASRSEAMSRECYIKSLSRPEKEKLVEKRGGPSLDIK